MKDYVRDMIDCITPADDRPHIEHSNKAVPFDLYMPQSFYHAATELQRSIAFCLDKPMRARAIRHTLRELGLVVEVRYLTVVLQEMRQLGIVECRGADFGHGYLWARKEIATEKKAEVTRGKNSV